MTPSKVAEPSAPVQAREPTRLEQVHVLAEALRTNRWIPYAPHPKQVEFLLMPDHEVLYGGAAGGGKTDALLMASLLFVDRPESKGLILGRTYSDLGNPDAIMARSYEWLASTAANWNEKKKQWKFPSRAVLAFSHLQRAKDVYNHDSASYDYIGWEEACRFAAWEYLFLFARNRGPIWSEIPLRIRSATNPGGQGHRFFYERFAIDGKPGKPFIPAKVSDNPSIDREKYDKVLDNLPPILRAQRKEGRWITDPRGKRYKMKWWEGKNRYHWETHKWRNSCIARWESWDTAEVEGEGHSYTACVTFEMARDYRVAVSNVTKERVNAIDVPDYVLDHARSENDDGKLEKGGIIVEDASSGRATIQALRARHDWLSDAVKAFRPGKYGDKDDERPQRAALWCGRDCVLLPHPCDEIEWLYDLETDLEMHPDITFKDVIDAFNQGIIFLDRQLAAGWRARGKVEEG